jgi:polyisoprenoid-binding protein YceI
MKYLGISLLMIGGVLNTTPLLYSMEFDFRPLASLCRVEVALGTSFSTFPIKGTFGQMAGKISFHPESPKETSGQVLLGSKSLRFGFAKVASDVHLPQWLNSAQHPQISFELEKITQYAWHGKELRSLALGVLNMRGMSKRVEIPLSIRYHRGERRKYEGKNGDLLRLDGLLTLSPSQLEFSFANPSSSVLDEISVTVSLTGASDRVRPFLPSRLFWR